MSEVRVTYSGLIAFAIRLTSVFTGMAFTLIVTRQLTQEEFGTWSLVGGLLLYVVASDSIIAYWVTREVARGEHSGKTAVGTGGFLAGAGVMAYIIIAFLVGNQSDAELDILLFAAILVPVMILSDIINHISKGWKPYLESIGFLAFEIAKIPVALALVYFLGLGVEGAIIATFVAYCASIIIQVVNSRDELKQKFSSKYVKKWFKLSWIPLYKSIPGIAFISDLVIFSIITGSVLGIAYFTAAKTIGRLVMHTNAFTLGVYPKLLSGGKTEYFQENLIRMFYFAIPLFILSVVMAKPGLFALNPVYEVAYPVVIFLSIRTFLSLINIVTYSNFKIHFFVIGHF